MLIELRAGEGGVDAELFADDLAAAISAIYDVLTRHLLSTMEPVGC